MTRRDGDTAGKMARLDKTENYGQNSTGNLEKELELSECETKPFATVGKPYVNSRHHSTGSGNGVVSDGTLPSTSRGAGDGTRTYENTKSLPGSRAGSRPGSRPGSRMHSRTNSQESIIDLFDCMTLTFATAAAGQNKR